MKSLLKSFLVKNVVKLKLKPIDLQINGSKYHR
jgi:hypothetical protein